MAYRRLLNQSINVDVGSPVNWTSHLNRDLVAWYLAFPGTCKGASRWPDISGHRNHATQTFMLPNTAWLDDAKRPGGFGICCDWDGTNDDYRVSDNNTLDITPDLTVAAWIRPTASGSSQYRTILAKRVAASATTNYQIYLSNEASANAGLLGYYNGVAEFKSSTVPPVNTWSHVAATVQGTALALYYNGLQVYTGTLSVVPATNSGQLYLGFSGTSNEFFKGRLDDVRIYKRALGIGEIWALYQASSNWYPNELRRVFSPAWEHAAAATGMKFHPGMDGNFSGGLRFNPGMTGGFNA